MPATTTRAGLVMNNEGTYYAVTAQAINKWTALHWGTCFAVTAQAINK